MFVDESSVFILWMQINKCKKRPPPNLDNLYNTLIIIIYLQFCLNTCEHTYSLVSL